MTDSSSTSKRIVGRFAPSPTGLMHAGNVFSALMSWLIVKSRNGDIVLRIEDLDVERSRPQYAERIMRDFEMLGLTWDRGPYYQHDRTDVYREAFEMLCARQHVYPCFCTRADLRALSAPHPGERKVYPGTCRKLTASEIARKAQTRKPAWRIAVPDAAYSTNDWIQGKYSSRLSSECGDFVIRRSDGLYAYQLASVVDDAQQGITCIVRGVDLLSSVPQQMFLQQALSYPELSYAHVPLLTADGVRRLSKRDEDAGIDELMARFKDPRALIGHIAYITGLTRYDEPVSCDELLASFKDRDLSTLFESCKRSIVWENASQNPSLENDGRERFCDGSQN